MDSNNIRREAYQAVAGTLNPEAAKVYLGAKMDQIEEAVRRKNPRAAVEIIDRIASDGYPEAANAIRTPVMALFAQDRRPQ